MPKQGFGSGAFGRRTRNLGRGGRRGGASFVLPPFGGIVAVYHDLTECYRWCISGVGWLEWIELSH